MIIRDYKIEDKNEVKDIFSKYWTDDVFLNELEKKLDVYTNKEKEYGTDTYRFYVAEKEGKIVGIAGLRKAPDYLRAYANTENPLELYVVASKFQKMGTGKALGQKIIEEAEKLNFTEILCYSPETHNSSWVFYEKLGFEKGGIIKDEDGYPGMLWKKIV